MASDDDDMIYKLLGDGDKDAVPRPPSAEPPRAEEPDGNDSQEPRAEDELNSYDLARQSDQAEEIGKKVHENPRRRKRSRSLHKADEVISPFTVRQGWFDGLFTLPYLMLTLPVALFFPMVVFPLAVLGVITAHDWESRRGALLAMSFCMFPVLVVSCLICAYH